MRVPGTLRAKFLFSLVLILALLTMGVLFVVRYRVELHVRQDIAQALQNSVATFRSLQQQRETTLERAAALVATLPPLKAVMTSGDPPTIQDASATFWKLAGSQLFVLIDRTGRIVALHATASDLPPTVVQDAVRRYMGAGMMNDWWYGNGHLYQVFFQPIYFGSEESGRPFGALAVGYEIDDGIAADLRRVASSEVAFSYNGRVVVTTAAAEARASLAATVAASTSDATPREIFLGDHPYLATTVRLSSAGSPVVALTVLRSFDDGTAFLASLNRWIVGIAFATVLAGALLIFLASTSITRPLGRLVSGVHALEQGDYAYPLSLQGSDEVAELTRAFATMRGRLQETQRRLLDAEQLATIGRMSSAISHDLRHPLTAIQAYAEFLAEGRLDDAQRKDAHEEIRLAVGRMTDEINSLLAFSKEGGALRLVDGDACDVIDRAIRTTKAIPEFEPITFTFAHTGPCMARFDPAKLERVMLNLLFNAGEAIAPHAGRVDVNCAAAGDSLEIRIADTGAGIPADIRERLFQPFVSSGKEKGIGLGLTVVQSIIEQHKGTIAVERTGPHGTEFRITLPR